MAAQGYIDRIKEADVSNGFMLEVFSREPGVIPDIARLWKVKERTLTRKLERLRARHRSMSKSSGRPGTREKVASFLEALFPIPVSSTPNPSSVHQEGHHSDQCENCKRLLQVCDHEKIEHLERLNHLRNNYEASHEELRTKLSKLRRRVRELNEIIGLGRKDLHRRYRRAAMQRTYWKEKFEATSSEVTKLIKAKEKTQKKAERFRQKYLRLKKQQQKRNVRSKVPPTKPCVPQDEDSILMMDKIDELETQIANLKAPIPTKDGRQFNTAIREASFYLQDIGVPEHKTSEAIRIVSETINGREIGCLPSTSTQHRMASEMKVLSKVQVREVLQDKENLTIKYDGTTKGRVGHLTEVEVASKEKTFLVGVSQQVGGGADEYVRTIEEACDAISPDILSKKTSNTMTDRCITNDAVDNKLEKEKNIHLNKFRCAMHPLDTIAKEVNKALKKLDDVHDRSQKMPFNKGGECNVQAFIRVGSKLFNSESCGDSTDLRAFLKGRGNQKVLPRWVGNRFDILFSSAGLLFHIGPSILEYFRTVTRPSNDLHRAFINAWNEKNVCHLRCLGLMGHFVTRPWMEAAAEETNILDMNARYLSAVQVLERWAGNPSSLLTDQHTIFSKDPTRDDIFQSLVSPPYEHQMDEPMRAMLTAALEVIKRQLQSQLPGGTFWQPSEEVREQAASCTSTNISGERNFARVDSHLHHARNISISKLESKVMFKCNDTAMWLKSQGEGRRKRLIDSAVKEGVAERKKDKVKKESYKKQVQQRVRDKQRKLSEKAEKERNKIEELIENVLQDGLYEERNQCELLQNMSKTKATGILRNQINFRKKILCQDMGKHSLSKSSLEELKNILFSGPELEDDDFLRNLRDPTQVINKTFAHKWEEEGKEVWYNGKVTAWKEEYEIVYDGSKEVFFMTVSEFLTDVHLGDICFV